MKKIYKAERENILIELNLSDNLKVQENKAIIMLAYQHISHQNFGRSSPRSNNESPLKRSLSPDDVMCRRDRESQIDYVRHQLRRQSLSRSASPIRSHSPAYTTTSHLKFANEQHQIKRSLSEEDLRINHERRRLSSDQKENDRRRDVIISHRPQILMNYRALKVEDIDDNKKSESEQFEASDEPDEDVPLDLSMGNKKQRGRSDSTTDSDDSTGMCDEGRSNEGRAYKKSLMKRYCELRTLLKL